MSDMNKTKRTRGMTKATMKRELTNSNGDLNHLRELYDKYPRIFIEASSMLPDKLKINVEKVIQERVPEVSLVIGERARRKAAEEEQMHYASTLSFEELVRLTVEKENEKLRNKKNKE
ncbi:hypothetical protein [Heliophilum fasciatum]|uniref:Uncharacterized protein n=1 Tax=Heliophilum fasciatum TaxID=35700 RepID=A0A4R2RKW0_9FIRM|nr:hypothetical protein [Heliophilum fasciatum]MCW2277878.1 hypothetical protein [Heliophilum fasciatum]TCP64552.1 hypothetical protein EDD73_10994 [Heliophilum fasciatum]